MPYHTKKWSEEEIENLKILYQKYTYKEIAILLDRSPESINGKIHHLGLKNNKSNWTKYGEINTKSKLYTIWNSAINRCHSISNKNHYVYKRYRGRGIIVCEEWRNDFSVFRDWALSNGYSEGLTLDRINNDGNYEPTNCRFVTQKEQSRNKSNNIYVTAWDETKLLLDWVDDNRCVVSYTVLSKRIRANWEGERALTTPNLGSNKPKTYSITAFGETKNIIEFSKDSRCVVKYTTLKYRIGAGWNPEDAILTPVNIRVNEEI